jgi:hypothetical protein
METIKRERSFRETCKLVAGRLALCGILLLVVAIICVGLPLAVLKG